MKQRHFSQDQSREPAATSPSAVAEDFKENRNDFSPSEDDAAGRATFSYVSQGLIPRRNGQRWLEVEAQLLAKRDLNRIEPVKIGMKDENRDE